MSCFALLLLRVISAPSQYPKRRLSVRSRKVSKPRDWYFKLSYRFEIWQAHRQHCCRSACHISERSDNSKYKYRGFETLRDLTRRRLFGYWDGALYPSGFLHSYWGNCTISSETHLIRKSDLRNFTQSFWKCMQGQSGHTQSTAYRWTLYIDYTISQLWNNHRQYIDVLLCLATAVDMPHMMNSKVE